jgi:hypothetical protein
LHRLADGYLVKRGGILGIGCHAREKPCAPGRHHGEKYCPNEQWQPAAARLLKDRKASTRPIAAAMSSQFTVGI